MAILPRASRARPPRVPPVANVLPGTRPWQTPPGKAATSAAVRVPQRFSIIPIIRSSTYAPVSSASARASARSFDAAARFSAT